jgi:arsenate reductase
MTVPQESVRPAPFITYPPRCVLFLCIHNSARSQMAEGFARKMAPGDAEIWSAGTEPGRVHPLAVEVMREVEIDITGQSAKHLNDVPLDRFDTVVTLCGEAEEACPVVRADVRRVHWPLPDPSRAPAEVGLETFRQVRDEIRWRVSALWGWSARAEEPRPPV